MNTAVHDDATYVDWLKVLYLLMTKIRREGLMSIECAVEQPEYERSIFAEYPRTLEQPYLEFATSVLRMMIAGNLDPKDMQYYADLALAGYAESGEVDMSLLRTIWTTLWASMSGYHPNLAVEFGRQAIPVRCKPTFDELESIIKQAKRAQSEKQEQQEPLDAAIDRFMASMQNQSTAKQE